MMAGLAVVYRSCSIWRFVRAALLLGFWTLASGALAQSPISVDEFLRDYRRALTELETRYARVRGKGTVTDEASRAKESIAHEIDFGIDGDMIRLIKRTKSSTYGGGKTVDTIEGLLATPRVSFIASIAPGATDYVVTSFGDSVEDYDTTRANIERKLFLRAPYCLDANRASDALSDPTFTIREIVRESGPQGALRVTFDADPRGGRGALADWNGAVHGTFSVLPERGWVMQSFDFTCEAKPSPFAVSGAMTYSGSFEGIGVLEKADISLLSGGRLITKSEFEVRGLDFSKQPSDWYTPDSMEMAASAYQGRWLSPALVFVLVLNAAVLVAVYFWKKATSRR